MARDHARTYVSIWGTDFTHLSAEAQRLYWVITSQHNLTYCGVLDYIPNRLANLAKDTDADDVQRALNELESSRHVVVDYDTSEILIRTFVRWDGLLDSPNVTKAMLKARALIMSDRLREALDTEISKAFKADPKRAGWKGFKAADGTLYNRLCGRGSGKGSERGSA